MFLKKFYALNKTTANIYIFFQYKENREFFLNKLCKYKNKVYYCKRKQNNYTMKNEIMDLTFYSHIKEILEIARKKTYNAINFAMVEAYWEIGKSIIKMQGGNLTSE